MKITKIYRTETGHIVSATHSDRCRMSHHGHSYVIEVTLEANSLDHAGMVLDFGVLKGPVRDFIDSFDHCYMINKYNTKEYEYFTENNERWISMPFNSSAEMMALMILKYSHDIVSRYTPSNGESEELKVVEVTVHETVTGRATANLQDVEKLWNPEWEKDIVFSDGVKKDWGKTLTGVMSGNLIAYNLPKPPQNVITHGFND